MVSEVLVEIADGGIGIEAESEAAPGHDPGPVGLGAEQTGGGEMADFAEGNGASAGEGEQVRVVAEAVVVVVDVGGEDVDGFVAGIIIRVGAGFIARGVAGGVGVPDPEQVMEAVDGGEPFEEHVPEAVEPEITVGMAAPPEPAAVHFVAGAPEDGNVAVGKDAQVGGDAVDLGFPGLMQGGAGGEEFLPALFREAAVGPEVLIAGGVAAVGDGTVPHEGNDRALLVEADTAVGQCEAFLMQVDFTEGGFAFRGEDFFRSAFPFGDAVTGFDQVGGTAVLDVRGAVALITEAEVPAEDGGGVSADACEGVAVAGAAGDVVVLGGEGDVSFGGVEADQEVAGGGGGVGIGGRDHGVKDIRGRRWRRSGSGWIEAANGFQRCSRSSRSLYRPDAFLFVRRSSF